MDKGMKALIGIAAAVFVINVFSISNLNKKVNELKNENEKLRSEIISTKNDLKGSIPLEMQRILRNNESNIDTYAFYYSGIDVNTKSINSQLKFSLKSSENIDRVKVSVQKENAEELLTDYAVTTDKINYSFTRDLPYKDNYEYYIYAETKDGGVKKLNTEAIYNSLNSQIADRAVMEQGGQGKNKEQTDFAFSLTNNTFGFDEFEIKDVKVECTLNINPSISGADQVIVKEPIEHTFDEYSKFFSNKNYTHISENSVAVSEAEEIQKELYRDGFTNECKTRYFTLTVKHDELNLKNDARPDLNFKVIVTYKNGEMQELY